MILDFSITFGIIDTPGLFLFDIDTVMKRVAGMFKLFAQNTEQKGFPLQSLTQHYQENAINC